MHDVQLEDRLRSVLRAEGDDLPMTITSSELERRYQLRRRRTRERWVSVVAAACAIVAVGAIAALGTGWLAPAVGTRVSPSPSIGLSRIERGTQARLVLEIEPTASGGGVVLPLHRDLAPTDYVVSVKVLCLGDGSLSFTDRTHVKELTCTKAASLDPVFQPDPILVPVIDGSFDTVLTVTPDIRYTMLVETVPVPDHMPKLSEPDGSIGMSSGTVTPTPGMGSGINQASGRMDGSTEWVQVVCLGPGVVSYTLGPVDHSTTPTTIETVCDGVPRENEIAIDFSGDQVIVVTSGDVAWQLVATRGGPLSSAVPSTVPSALREPLGRPSDAILVTPTGDPARPDSLVVTLLDPSSATSTTIATIPGTFLPADGRLEPIGPPTVSATGWLSIPYLHSPDPDSPSQAIAVVDLTDPETSPWVIDDFLQGSWNGDDQLLLATRNGVTIAEPSSRTLVPFATDDRSLDFRVNPRTGYAVTSTAPGASYLVRRSAGGTDPVWGFVGPDGAFTATTDLPPAFQRTGIERPAGDGAHILLIGCDSAGTPGGAGCALAEFDQNDALVATRVGGRDGESIGDFVWAADGREVWVLLDGGESDGTRVMTLSLADAPGSKADRSQFSMPSGTRPAILGIASETETGPSALFAIGDDTGFVRAFVAPDGGVTAMDGTAWFAGWAGEQPDYDPD